MITIVKNGKFTGTQYTTEQFDKEVQDFHLGQNETWIEKEVFNIAPISNEIDGQEEFAEVDYGSPTERELWVQTQSEFRIERNRLLNEIDIEINIAFDAGVDTSLLSIYRQGLRDSTDTFVLPTHP